MRRILILRHAKSDWDAPYGDDHDRPLAARGVRAAERVGRALAALGRRPDHVWTSSAVRAREMTAIVLEFAGFDLEPRVDPALYGISVEGLVMGLRALPDAVEEVLVVGHEPTLGATVSHLQGGGRVRFPTAALACLHHEGGWDTVTEGSCTLQWLVKPKLLKAWSRSS